MRKHEQTGVCNWSSIVLGACPTDTYGRCYILFIEDGVCYRINYITASKTGPLLKDSPPPHCFFKQKHENYSRICFLTRLSCFPVFSFLHSFLQITTLINHKDKPKKSERTLAAIHRVGQAVSVAVGRFVAVGEAIAAENQELKDEMGQACFEARRAGEHLWLGLVLT